MRSRALDTILEAQQRVLTILWLALLGSIGIYTAVAYIVAPAMEPAAEDATVLVIVLSVVAVFTAIASMVVPRKLLPDETLLRHMRSNERASKPNAKLSEHEQRLARVRGLYMVPWLVGAVLAEAVALFGFVLTLLTANPALVIPFAIIGGVLLVLRRPNVVAFIERADTLSR
jgi:hypothetical protein